MVTSPQPRAATHNQRHPRSVVRAALMSKLGAQPARWLLALVLLLGAAVRLWLLTRDVPTLDSDEAVIGLMALHLQHGEWSVFFWGQHYMGSLEAVIVAPFLWLFGPSPLTLRLAPMLLGLGGIATVYLLGKRIFSARVGLVAATLLALGPPFFVVLSVRAYGGYVETLLLGNILLLLALAGASPAGRRTRITALVGLLAGVALWTNLLVAPYLLAAGVIWWWQRRVDLLRRRNALALAGGVLLGVAPAVVENLRNGGATLTTILGLTVVGAGGAASAHTSPLTLLHNLWLIATVSLPILVGTAFGGTQAAGYTPDEYSAAGAAHPLAYGIGLALVALALLVMASGAARVVRGWRSLRAAEPAATRTAQASAALAPALVQRQGEAALLLVGICYLAAFCLNKQLSVIATPRYLFPLYSVTPLLVAWSARLARSVWGLAAHMDGRLYAGGVALALALLVAWNVAGAASLTPERTAARDHGVWIAGRDDALVRLLHTHQVRTVISNDYWEGLRLTYESGESVIAVMVTPEGHPGFNRYQPYIAQGLADPRPAYLELADTYEARLDLTRLRAGQLPGYTAVAVGGYTVLLPA